jgi:hypothetical protein
MAPKSNIALAMLASTALAGGAAAQRPADPGMKTYTISLTGQAEVSTEKPTGGAGDLDASGSVTLKINPGKKQVCYDFDDLTGLATLAAAHIHQAPALQNGPIFIGLFTGSDGKLEDCVAATSAQLAQIVAKPSNFYVNVHTSEFPAGAIRGQLSR